jgi:hypothetical protein
MSLIFTSSSYPSKCLKFFFYILEKFQILQRRQNFEIEKIVQREKRRKNFLQISSEADLNMLMEEKKQ